MNDWTLYDQVNDEAMYDYDPEPDEAQDVVRDEHSLINASPELEAIIADVFTFDAARRWMDIRDPF